MSFTSRSMILWWCMSGPIRRISVLLWYLAWDSPSAHGSTTIAIGIDAVCMSASGVRDGDMTGSGIAGVEVRIAAS